MVKCLENRKVGKGRLKCSVLCPVSLQKKAEQEEADAERSNRRGKYYGDDGDKLAKPRPHIYLFSQDDLDNEDVILEVESIPTFNRTKPMLNEIKKKSAPEQVREEQPVKDKVEGTIRFE